MRRSILAALALVLVASPAVAQAPTKVMSASVDSMARARKWTTWFYSGAVDSLLSAYPAENRTAENKSALGRNYLQLAGVAGTELSVVEERFIKRNGNTQYWRTANFSVFTAEPLMIRWAVNKNWEIIGFGINPASQAPAIDKP